MFIILVFMRKFLNLEIFVRVFESLWFLKRFSEELEKIILVEI